MDGKKFTIAYIEAYLKGEPIAYVAKQLNIKKSTATAYKYELRRMGVNLPKLERQPHPRKTVPINPRELNKIIRQYT